MSLTLTTQEMRETLSVFSSTFEWVFSRLGEDDQFKVKSWYEASGRMIPCVSLRPDGLQKIIDDIFLEEPIRDFMFNLSFRFFTICSEGDQFVLRLAGNVAQGLTCDGPNTKWSLIPAKLRESLAQSVFDTMSTKPNSWQDSKYSTTLEGFLESNKLLLLVYLIHLSSSL